MTFSIKILTKNDVIELKDLSETETREILADAYDSIARVEEYVTFKQYAKVKALDLVSFYIM